MSAMTSSTSDDLPGVPESPSADSPAARIQAARLRESEALAALGRRLKAGEQRHANAVARFAAFETDFQATQSALRQFEPATRQEEE